MTGSPWPISLLEDMNTKGTHGVRHRPEQLDSDRPAVRG